ncbi:hypothetical protein ACQR1W_12780 [Bradyrhizobium sp. HKCCYLS1011]|uniref:hypothetical protein n=1 Tax=Bradyrhizobium sp. HKCCYLS1011 TaxID=3420733 RepID=UPI003EB73F55
MQTIRNHSEALASLGKSGPTPVALHLVLHPAPVWMSKAGKKRVGRRFWYIEGDGAKPISTKCSQENKAGAEAVLATRKRKQMVGLLGEHAPDELTIAEILDDDIEQKEKIAFTPPQKRTARTIRHQYTTIKRLMGRLALADYTSQHSIDFLADYVGERMAYYAAHPDMDPKDPEPTGLRILKLLKKAVESFVERKGLLWSKAIHVPKRRKVKKAKRWLRKQELARLLWGCLYEIDKKTGRLKTKTVIDEDGTVRTVWIRHKGAKKRAYYHLSRLIRFIIKTGTRHEVSIMMTYGFRPDISCIDCDGDGRGLVHRRGYEEEDTNKARPPSPIHAPLARMLARWARMDGHIDRATGRIVDDGKVRYLVLDGNGKPYRNHIDRQFRTLVRSVGLRGITLHTLKHTSVNYAYQSGQTRSGAALMLGTTEKTLAEYYTDWKEEGHFAEVLREFDDPAKLLAFRRLRHFDPLPSPRPRHYVKPFREADGATA